MLGTKEEEIKSFNFIKFSFNMIDFKSEKIIFLGSVCNPKCWGKGKKIQRKMIFSYLV